MPTIDSVALSRFVNSHVDSLVRELSLEEKAGQVIMVYNSPPKFLAKHGFGAVLVMSNMLKHPDKLKRDLARSRELLPLGLLVGIDQEGGKVNRLSRFDEFRHLPSARASRDLAPDSLAVLQFRVARRLKSLGIDLNLAPVLDPFLNQNGDSTFMALRQRSYGTGSTEIGPPSRIFVKSFKEAGVGCVVKHFPGYDARTNSDHEAAVSEADSLTVARNAAVFAEGMRGALGIMMSSIRYTAFDGEPSVFSKRMTGWARQLAGDRLLVTDDLWGMALRAWMLPGEKIHRTSYPDEAFARLVEKAFLAGNDLLMVTFPAKAVLMKKTIVRLAKKNPDAARHLDDAVRRVLLAKLKLGPLRPGKRGENHGQ